MEKVRRDAALDPSSTVGKAAVFWYVASASSSCATDRGTFPPASLVIVKSDVPSNATRTVVPPSICNVCVEAVASGNEIEAPASSENVSTSSLPSTAPPTTIRSCETSVSSGSARAMSESTIAVADPPLAMVAAKPVPFVVLSSASSSTEGASFVAATEIVEVAVLLSRLPVSFRTTTWTDRVSVSGSSEVFSNVTDSMAVS